MQMMGQVRNYEEDSPEGPRKKKSVYHTPQRTRVITLLNEGVKKWRREEMEVLYTSSQRV
jgi:hypothetical protein